MARETSPSLRLCAIFVALFAGMAGYGLAEAITAARMSDAFAILPSLTRLASYGIALAVLMGLALAIELGGPPVAAQGGRAARRFRAAIRWRFRHGRTRAEIATVETGLTISFCAVLTVVALILASAKSILVIMAAAVIWVTVQAAWALCGLVGFRLKWSGLVGFLYGLAAGYLLT